MWLYIHIYIYTGFHLENCPRGASGGIWNLREGGGGGGGMLVKDVKISLTPSVGSRGMLECVCVSAGFHTGFHTGL